MTNIGDHDQVPPLRDASRQPDNDVTAVAAFANTIETSFIEIGQSLTDPATRAAYLRTLDIWERALQGSREQGVIDTQQLADLTQVIEGMRQAPTLL
ncbi:hypothetical protein DMH12_36170 [Streptomyces sp. WAC 04229]|uniref:hypothetical protein n=1 Tax=Streptomyces sp. WAC 04229 TaxID=2203206 RepID=UPI000F73804A|nr:hypothetical protein [Streptomyces sp. WAC 04229]RSN39993.1 hypothetical protein DMH12_36170 [Streptomyces sp. WAC 04229]